MQTPQFVKDFKAQFPFFDNNPDVVYLDNAATTQKPQVLINALSDYYSHYNANVHRAGHKIAAHTTTLYEQARATVAKFINAGSNNEVIWTKGTTDSINLIAAMLGQSILQPGDEIIVTELEHHANFVPWQQLAQSLKINLVVLPYDNSDQFLKAVKAAHNNKTRVIAFTHVSNVFGDTLPVNAICEYANNHNIITVVDGAQAIAHHKVDVQALGCDFYAFSAHKMYGPTGLGVMYGKQTLLEQLDPVQFGGEMVKSVTIEQTCFAKLPHKLEPGTPDIAGVISFASVIDFLSRQDRTALISYEKELYQYFITQLQQLPFVNVLSKADANGAVSFLLNDCHPYDVAELLNQMNIAIRAGSHCAQPLMQARNLVNGTLRASICGYTSVEDIDAFISALKEVETFIYD